MNKYILVTGAYGFIGSKFVKYLNSLGITDIIVSDYLTNGKQFKNLNGAKFYQYVVPEEAINFIKLGLISKVFHFGAISDTTCWDGELVMQRNYHYSTQIIDACANTGTFVSYSSSASVYGNDGTALNIYAYSKHLVEKYAAEFNNNKIQGFRYFNVYSHDDAEWHKGKQASPFYQFKQQALETGEIKVFEGSAEIYRDFVHVDYVCAIQWMMSDKKVYGVFDLGSGAQMSFLEVANNLANIYKAKVVEIPFPEHLKDCYQYNTKSNMDYLKEVV